MNYNEYQSDANQDFRDYQADKYEKIQNHKAVPRNESSSLPFLRQSKKEAEGLNE